LIALAGLTAFLALPVPRANTQDLSPTIHYKSQSPPEAQFELLQSALVARLTLLVDKYSGDVFQLVAGQNGGVLWQKIPRMKLMEEQTGEMRVNFQVFTSGIAARDTFLLNIHTGRVWQLVEDFNKHLYWTLMNYADDPSVATNGSSIRQNTWPEKRK
jgi:hypothetical protein